MILQSFPRCFNLLPPAVRVEMSRNWVMQVSARLPKFLDSFFIRINSFRRLLGISKHRCSLWKSAFWVLKMFPDRSLLIHQLPSVRSRQQAEKLADSSAYPRQPTTATKSWRPSRSNIDNCTARFGNDSGLPRSLEPGQMRRVAPSFYIPFQSRSCPMLKHHEIFVQNFFDFIKSYLLVYHNKHEAPTNAKLLSQYAFWSKFIFCWH